MIIVFLLLLFYIFFILVNNFGIYCNGNDEIDNMEETIIDVIPVNEEKS